MQIVSVLCTRARKEFESNRTRRINPIQSNPKQGLTLIPRMLLSSVAQRYNAVADTSTNTGHSIQDHRSNKPHLYCIHSIHSIHSTSSTFPFQMRGIHAPAPASLSSPLPLPFHLSFLPTTPNTPPAPAPFPAHPKRLSIATLCPTPLFPFSKTPSQP